MPLLDDQVVNRDRSKFYFTLLTKIDPEPEGPAPKELRQAKALVVKSHKKLTKKFADGLNFRKPTILVI